MPERAETICIWGSYWLVPVADADEPGESWSGYVRVHARGPVVDMSDCDYDLTPEEARQLGVALIAAAAHVEQAEAGYA